MVFYVYDIYLLLNNVNDIKICYLINLLLRLISTTKLMRHFLYLSQLFFEPSICKKWCSYLLIHNHLHPTIKQYIAIRPGS